jgi:hypothetical protein
MSNQVSGVLARLRQPVALRGGARRLVGGSPQVSLLPAEVREAGAVAAHRRKLIALVVVAAVVAAGAIVVAQQVRARDEARLADANRQSQMLSSQLAKFADVRALQKQIAVGKAGVSVGSSTLIDWQQQIDLIEAAMPAGYTVTSLNADGATPLAIYPQSENLLEPRRAATILMTTTSATSGDEFSRWLSELRDIPSYSDATANVSYNTDSGTYTTDLTIHLGGKVLSAKAWTER